MEGLRDAVSIAKGEADPSTYRVHVPAKVDVRAIRKKLDLTQEEFAAQFGFTAASVRDWEQGRVHPVGAARAYLIVIDKKPKAVREALRPERVKPSKARKDNSAQIHAIHA